MKKKNWFWGILLILTALLLVAGQFGWFLGFSGFTIIATILLGAAFVDSAIKRNFVGMLLSLALLYSVLDGPLNLPSVNIWWLILAAVIGGIGLSMLFRQKPKNYNYIPPPMPAAGNVASGMQASEHPGNGGFYPPLGVDGNVDDNHPSGSVSFGSAVRYLHSDNLQSGQFSVSFGALEVFFDGAVLSPSGAELFLDCSFGNIKLYVPCQWRVVDNINATLAGVNNDTTRARVDANAPILTLAGNVQFGSIDVEYI